MDWSDLRVFLAAVRAGSATRAAVELGMGVSTVTRRLGALEQAIGQPLVVRTPTGIALTPAGEALLPHAVRVESAVHAGRAAVGSLQEPVRGEVVVALPSDMLLLVLLPRLRPFLEAHPHITLAFDQHNRVADLRRREADIAVRTFVPEDGEELIATRLRQVEFVVFSRREDLDRMDDPSDPRQHRWVGWVEGLSGAPPVDLLAQGRYAVRCSSPVTVRHAIAAGLGSGVLPRIFGRLMPNVVEAPVPFDGRMPLYMITHRAIRGRPRVAAVWDELERLLRAGDPADEEATLREALAVYGWSDRG